MKTDRKISIIKESLKNDKWLNYYCDYDYESWQPPAIRVKWIANQIKQKNSSILDIGCGATPVSKNINAAYKVGMDISLPVADQVIKYFDRFYIADLNNLKKTHVKELLGKFDYVILAETLEHFEDSHEILSKIRWFLKPTGKLILTYPNHFSLSMYIDYIINGFQYVRFKDFMEGHFTFYSKDQLDFVFDFSGYKIDKFEYRSCDIIPEVFPKESNEIWKLMTKISPKYLAHQFFYNLSLDSEPQALPKRFKAVLHKGVRIIKENN